MENLKNVAPIEDFNWDAYENGETPDHGGQSGAGRCFRRAAKSG